MGECAFEQQGLEAMRRALTPPLVDHADDAGDAAAPTTGTWASTGRPRRLAVVVVSDDDDTSPDAVSTYVRFLQQLKGAGAAGRASLYAIVPSGETCPTRVGPGASLRRGRDSHRWGHRVDLRLGLRPAAPGRGGPGVLRADPLPAERDSRCVRGDGDGERHAGDRLGVRAGRRTRSSSPPRRLRARKSRSPTPAAAADPRAFTAAGPG